MWRVGAPCGAALPLLSSPHCSGWAELLRSFELASDAIVPISFLCLVTVPVLGTWMTSPLGHGQCPHNCVPTVFRKVLSKICRNPEVLWWLKAQRFLQCFCCWSQSAWFSSVLLSSRPESTVKSEFCRRGSDCFLSGESSSASSTNSNQSFPPLADNFMDLFLSRYVLHASVVCTVFIKPLKSNY